MKFLKNKNIVQKTAIVLLTILVFGFINTTHVEAASSSVGGKLLEPVCDLIVSIGDGINNVLHTVIYHQNDTLIHVDMTNGILATVLTIGAFIVAAVVVAAAVVLTAGAVVAAAAAVGATLSTIGIGTVLLVSVAGGVAGAAVFNSTFIPDDLYLPVYSVSPEEIFSNSIPLFDVDFFNPSDSIDLEDGTTMQSTAAQLKSTIANWYVILRDIAIVALLSILVYIGIRIVISSTAADKSKYKQFLVDWIVSICLLFMMQYIMSFSNLVVEKITTGLTSLDYDKGYFALIEDEDGKIEDALTDAGYDVDSLKIEEEDENGDTHTYINWKTNLMGVARLNAQMAKDSTASYAGYTVIFLILVMFTVFFVFTYIKRILYMAFLTLIAPLVAMTYPIDKMNDGKAQAFDMWIKEYIFNLLIQPMHLLLYTILITSAFELASQNIIYSIVALAFMVPAEKLLRKFFGFEKAHTPGLLAGPAGAAATMTAMNKLLGRAPKGPKPQGAKSSSGLGSSDEKPNIKYKNDVDTMDTLMGGQEDNSNISPRQQSNEIDLPDANQQGSNLLNGTNSIDSSNIDGQGANIRMTDTEQPESVIPQSEESQFIEDRLSSRLANNQKAFGETFANTQFGQGLNYAGGKIRAAGSKVGNSKAIKGIKNLPNKSRTVRAGVNASKFYAAGMANKLREKAKNAHPIRTAARTAAGVAGGVALGSLGLAAGVASGDPSKMLQYTAAGAFGGYKGAAGTASSLADTFGVSGSIEEAKKSYYGDEYDDKQRENYIKDFQKNYANKQKFEKKFGKDAKQIMNEDVPKYIENGITNKDEMIAAKTIQNNGLVEDRNTAIAVAKYANQIGDTNKMSSKKYNEHLKTLSDGFEKRGVTKDVAEQKAKERMDAVDKYNKVKFK